MTSNSRSQLLEAALPLFAKKGFAAVSIRELAETAQVNSALINYHFGGKEGLYTEMIRSQMAKVEQMIGHLKNAVITPEERIQKFIEGLIKIHQQNPYIRRLMHSELSNPTACFQMVMKDFIGKFYTIMVETIREGIENGSFRPDLDPSFATISIAGMIHFYFIAQPFVASVLPEELNRDERFGLEAFTIFLQGIRHPAHV